MIRLLSRNDRSLFGSFHYPYGIVEHSMDQEALDIALGRNDISLSAGTLEGAERVVGLAYQAASYLHEVRHFYDQFGTLGGISLFSSFLECLKDFDAAARRLAIAGDTWPWPVSQVAHNPTSPMEARRFVRSVRAFRTASMGLLGSYHPLEVDGHVDGIIAPAITVLGHEVHVAVLRFVSVVDGKQVPKSFLHPLGLEALFESNAHALSRTFVEQTFPKALAAILTQDVMRIEGEAGRQPVFSQRLTSHMILDRLVSKYLRGKGREKFERDTVIGIADEALSLSSIGIEHVSEKDTKVYIREPSIYIQRLLDNADIEDLVAGRVPASERVNEAYKGLLATLEKGGDWDTVHDDGSLLSAIRIWESYVAQHFTVPLLRRRIATDHKAFRSFVGFADLLREIRPPIMSMGGHIDFSLPDAVRSAWARVLHAGEIMLSVAEDGDPHCPRAHRTVPGLSNVTFATEHHCNDHIVLGCGRFDGSTVEMTPCMFVDMLQRLRLLL